MDPIKLMAIHNSLGCCDAEWLVDEITDCGNAICLCGRLLFRHNGQWIRCNDTIIPSPFEVEQWRERYPEAVRRMYLAHKVLKDLPNGKV